MADTTAPEYQPLYELQRHLFDHVLEDGDSLITPSVAVWTREHLDELQQHFVEQPDDTPGRTFLEKLHLQLANASQPARQLMAELLIEHLLIVWPGAISGRSKISTVETVLSWMSSPPALTDEIRAALARGPVHPGQWYLTRRDLQLTWLIQFFTLWLDLPAERRAQLRADPWAFRDLTDPITELNTENSRLATLHLTFPHVFEAIVSPVHRQAIVQRFADVPGSETDIDRRLLELRSAFTEGDEHFDWYSEPVRHVWQKDPKKWRALMEWVRRAHETPELTADERPYKLELAGRLRQARKAFLAGDPGWPRRLREVMTDKTNNLTRWQDHVPLLDWVDANAEDAVAAFQTLWRSEDKPERRLAAFLDALPADALGMAVGVRVNVGSFLLMGEDPAALPTVKITPLRQAWVLAGWGPDKDMSAAGVYERALALFGELVRSSQEWSQPLGDALDAQSALWSITSRPDAPSSWPDQKWDDLRRFRGEDLSQRRPDEPSPEPEVDVQEETVDHVAEAAADLLVDRVFLDELVYLLDDKKQIVLYGPPGTGKTFLAKRLARAVAEGRPDRVRLVQFHPAMSYEDFIEGLRPAVLPDGQVTYLAAPGPFLRAAEAARSEPGVKHVLVIDEINRANLPKVLGELLFLLEYRDESINLMLRPDAPFTLPDNLLVIGTMNTADRSVALVDAALRRRFHFVPFFPHDGAMRGLLGRWLAARGGPAGIATFLDAVNAELVDTVGEHLLIGPSHFMRTDLSEHALRRIWTYNVYPLIEEQLWGQRDEVQRWRWDAVRERFGAAFTGSETSASVRDDSDA